MQRNLALDIFKVILSILVITIHCQPILPDRMLVSWTISNGLARIAVPCFLIISGYFISSKLESRNSFTSYLKHVLILYILWSIIYLPTYWGDVAPRSILTFWTMGYYHLWFVPALLIGVLMLYFVQRKLNKKQLLTLSCLLLMAGYFLEHSDIYYRYYCNAIFIGFPFITIGYIMRGKTENKSVSYHVMLILIGGLLLFSESLINYFNSNISNLYIGLIILCPAIISLLMKSKLKYNSSCLSQLSTGVYLIHVLVIDQLLQYITNIDTYKLPLAIVISLVLATFITFINKPIKHLL